MFTFAHFMPVLAQQYSDASYPSTEVSSAAGGVVMAFMCIFSLVGLAAFALWLWALIDCCGREFEGSGKTMWILIILFGCGIGPIIYLFVGRGQGYKAGGRGGRSGSRRSSNRRSGGSRSSSRRRR